MSSIYPGTKGIPPTSKLGRLGSELWPLLTIERIAEIGLT